MYADASKPVAASVSTRYGTSLFPAHFENPREQNDCSYAVTCPFRFYTWKLVAFHLLNVLFSSLAFGLVLGGLLFGISLIPLCCLGLVVLRLLLWFVYHLAKIDVLLYNSISPPNEHITVTFAQPEAYEGYRLSPELSSFSKDSVIAIIYFSVFKFPLSILFSSALVVMYFASFVLIAFPFTFDDGFQLDGTDIQVLGRPLHIEDWPFMVFFGIILLYFTIFLMHMCAKILRWTTKFCTTEYYSLYEFTNGVPLSNAHLYTSSKPLQGTGLVYA
jgi:hypothetical protein